MKWCCVKALRWFEFLIPICRSDCWTRSGWGQHGLSLSSLAEQAVPACPRMLLYKSAGGWNPQWRQVSPVQVPLHPVTLRNLLLAPLPCLCMRNVLPVMLIPILLKSKHEWVYSMRPQIAVWTGILCQNYLSFMKNSWNKHANAGPALQLA